MPDNRTPVVVVPVAVGTPSLHFIVRRSPVYPEALPPIGVKLLICPPPLTFRVVNGHCTQSLVPTVVRSAVPEEAVHTPDSVADAPDDVVVAVAVLEQPQRLTAASAARAR